MWSKKNPSVPISNDRIHILSDINYTIIKKNIRASTGNTELPLLHKTTAQYTIPYHSQYVICQVVSIK